MARQTVRVKVLLRNPRRELEIEGRRSVNALLAELGLAREAHLVIHNGTLIPGDAELATDDVAFRAWHLGRFFGRTPRQPVHVFLYPSAAAKHAWMGADKVDLAKPWLGQVHLTMPEYGDSVLAHELAHTYAASLTRSPIGLPGRLGLPYDALLVEGVAMAAEPAKQARPMAEDPAVEADQIVYQRTIAPEDAPDKATVIAIDFEKGDAERFAAIAGKYRTATVIFASKGGSLSVPGDRSGKPVQLVQRKGGKDVPVPTEELRAFTVIDPLIIRPELGYLLKGCVDTTNTIYGVSAGVSMRF